jgi:DNA-binding GntR family transcriptional regulator
MPPSSNGARRATAAPRYQRVADDLMKRIGSGKYPVGDYLPTEMELCQRYGISRHTVREALRQLRDSGLICRRRRVGTEVVARTPKAGYKQPTNQFGDLLQYSEESQVSILETKPMVCDAALAEMLESRKGARWLRVSSLRAVSGDSRPICMTTAYLDLRLPDLEQHLAELSGPISATLEKVYGIGVARIEQSIQAVRLGKRQARLLRALDGSPALKAIRRCYDQNGRLIEYSNAIHPGERFTYVASFAKS